MNNNRKTPGAGPAGRRTRCSLVFKHQCFLSAIRERIDKLRGSIFAGPKEQIVALHVQLHITPESVGQMYGLKTRKSFRIGAGKLLP